MNRSFIGQHRSAKLRNFFPIDKTASDVALNFNAAPSREILAIVRQAGANRLVKFHWGLVPFWAKDVSIGKKMINARVESIAAKPSFRHAFRYRRCLIPADGFYEWCGSKEAKQAVFITLPNRTPFAFAGLWETWQKKDVKGSVYKSCAIITTRSSESFRKFHHRMPIILRPVGYTQWLDPQNQNIANLLDLLKNEIITTVVSHPVSHGRDLSDRNNPPFIHRKPKIED